jgi:hypothetical protein
MHKPLISAGFVTPEKFSRSLESKKRCNERKIEVSNKRAVSGFIEKSLSVPKRQLQATLYCTAQWLKALRLMLIYYLG